MKQALIVLTILCLSSQGISVWGQQNQEEFGKNRIQYKQYTWSYLSSDHFDLYYSQGQKNVATEAIQYLEEQFDRITELIGYYPSIKTKIFLYNSVAELQQTNIGLHHAQFNTGGETEFIKANIEVAHPGSSDELKKELIRKTTEVLINEMIFGGDLKERLKNALLLNLPEWFIAGLSNYTAKGWDDEMDDYIRRLMYTKKINRALQFNEKEAELVGQSIWNYIVEQYGKSSVSNILNYTRVVHNERKSILIILGVNFRTFIKNWQQYYTEMQDQVIEHYVPLEDSTRISSGHRKYVVYTTAKLSPDGSKLAYAENNRGRFVIKIKSLINDKEIIILRGGNKVFRQEVNYTIPLISWVNQDVIGVIGMKRGQYMLWLYDIRTRITLPRKLNLFNNVQSFSFSENGRLAVLSADSDGKNDLFLISTLKNRTRRLTNDIYDDIDPSFFPGSNIIVFSSNRLTDTLNTVKKGINKLSDHYNLYTFHLDTTTQVAARLTKILGKNYQPKAYDQNNIYYLSNQNGIINIFRFNQSTKIYSQTTNFYANIKSYDLSFANSSLALITRKRLKDDIFVIPQFRYNRQTFTPSTRRKEIQQAKELIEKKQQKNPQQNLSIKELINFRAQEAHQNTTFKKPYDSAIQHTPVDSVRIKSLEPKATENGIYTTDSVFTASKQKEVNRDKNVSTEQYTFEDEPQNNDTSLDKFLNKYMKAKEKNQFKGPFLYEPRVTYENLVTNMVIDPLNGWSIKLESQMNDILENYRFFGGIQATFDLEGGNLYGEVQYLPHRIDYSARIDRKTIVRDGASNRYKYTWQKIELGASLPISVRLRFTLKPFLGYTEYIDRGTTSFSGGPPVFSPSESQMYGGYKAELVYDNSLTTGLNIIEGTRGKLNFIQYEGLENNNLSFYHAFVDMRHYQKIYKEVVFAVRGYIGTFFGNAPKKYLLGGMNNWIQNQANTDGKENPLARTEGFNKDLIFTEFATNIRGFKYATLYGNSVALMNAEVRLPLIRALSSGPISSNFFRSLQFTLFYDIGTSWNGPFSFASNNSVPRIVPENPTGSPFQIEIRDFLNPWIYSYGAGFRAKMLGFYMKFDVAWPVENYKTKVAQLLVTLGLDF